MSTPGKLRTPPQAQLGADDGNGNGSVEDKRLDALKAANRIRRLRARTKLDLKLGTAQPQVIVVSPPEWMATATVESVLVASERIGPITAARILRRAGISATRELGSLTKAERRRLAIAIVCRGPKS